MPALTLRGVARFVDFGRGREASDGIQTRE